MNAGHQASGNPTLVEIYPEKRHDREFRCLIIDTLKVERAAYRALHEYMEAHDWGKR